jgi:HSP20 family protein
MAEHPTLQEIPVKMYRTDDLLTVAAPMPGLESDDVAAEVREDGRLVLRGALRGALKDVKTILVDEWSAGPYTREVRLPVGVDGPSGRLSYGNGVLVVVLPIAPSTRAAELRAAA